MNLISFTFVTLAILWVRECDCDSVKTKPKTNTTRKSTTPNPMDKYKIIGFPIERYHNPTYFTSTASPFVDGSEYKVPPPYQSPDFRVPEPVFLAYRDRFFWEQNRPYRISPHWKQTKRWNKADNSMLLGCYCTTVYKRLTLLAGCAVITSRHILTTASSTDRALRMLKEEEPDKRVWELTNKLGAWYDSFENLFNSSYYMTPCRIHFHPNFVSVDTINRSHPIPHVYDLAVWSATFRFMNYHCVCQRAGVSLRGSLYGSITPPSPLPGELNIIVGFQMIKAYNRRPVPWYKYAIRTRDIVLPCPKVEWGWFFCLAGRWAHLGVDNGAALHKALHGRNWRYDGLFGLGAFSMTIRARMLTHYFTALDQHPVLDFLYNAYMGRQNYNWLDWRYYDTKWMSPLMKPWLSIQHTYYKPSEDIFYNAPWFRKK